MSINKVEAILSAQDRGFSSVFQKCEQTATSFGEKMKSGLGFGMWQEVGRKAVNAVFGLIESNVDSAISRVDTINNYGKVLESLGYSAEDASKSLRKIQENFNHLPVTLDQMASRVQQLLPMMDSVDDATEMALALSNAMAAGGQSAEQQANAISQWTQAMAKGKPDHQDWLAMVQTAPAQMDQLSKSILGATANQQDLYEAMQSGAVTMDEVNAEMIKLSKEGGEGFASWEEQAKSASDGIQLAMLTIQSAVSRNLGYILEALDDVLEPLGGLSGLIKSLEKPIEAFGSTMAKVIKGDMKFGDAMEEMLGTVGAKAKEFMPKAMEVVSNFIAGIGQQGPQIFIAGVNMITDFLIGIAQKLPDVLVSAINAITTWLEGISQGQSSIFAKAGELVKTLVVGIVTHLPEIGMAIAKLMVQLLKSIVKYLPDVLQAGMTLVAELIAGIVSKAGELGSKVLDLAKKIPEKIREGIESIKDIGGEIVEGIKAGLKEKWDAMVEWFKGLAEKLPKGVRKVLGIASPSKVFKEIGAYTTEGFAIGIESNYKAVQSAVNGLYSTMPTKTQMRGMSASLSGDYMYNAQGTLVIDVPVNLDGRQIANVVTEVQTAEQFREARKQGVR